MFVNAIWLAKLLHFALFSMSRFYMVQSEAKKGEGDFLRVRLEDNV
jgi:hypothetical protein